MHFIAFTRAINIRFLKLYKCSFLEMYLFLLLSMKLEHCMGPKVPPFITMVGIPFLSVSSTGVSTATLFSSFALYIRASFIIVECIRCGRMQVQHAIQPDTLPWQHITKLGLVIKPMQFICIL